MSESSSRGSDADLSRVASAQRRIDSIGGHVVPGHARRMNPVAAAPGTAVETTQPSSSYQRVHGNVSREQAVWDPVSLEGVTLEDVLYTKASGEGIAKISINRPHRRNAFRPQTVQELQRCFTHARDDDAIGVIILTGEGTKAFCSGGDQAVRGAGGYVGKDGVPRLNVLDLQVCDSSKPAWLPGHTSHGQHKGWWGRRYKFAACRSQLYAWLRDSRLEEDISCI